MATAATSVFSLLVTLQFTSDEYKEEFFKIVKPLADYIQSSEPDTLSFEVILHDKDPLQVMLLERYKDKANAFLEIHRNSAAFLEYRPKLKAMQDAGQLTISGNSYLDSGLGFGDRA
mmetsp:Transcript_17175/g.25388  ORF Transcript_17175/g.25388 Transcript_17175/m.25388 type:complete len:117 (-) Transcript_17175:7119-7469(-)